MIRFLCLAMLLPVAGHADTSGPLDVRDGDTFVIGDVRVRLFGVDAPEAGQTCTDRAGDVWSCGEWVTARVAEAYEGRIADCVMVDIDRYGREVSRCSVNGADLGRELVRAGYAFAYRDYSWDYDLDEKAAALAGAGIWSGGFERPADFRAAVRAAPDPDAPPGCPIKGNISNAGRIYHQPGDPSYADTRIDPARGERWFCSVEDAEAAGWRAPRG